MEEDTEKKGWALETAFHDEVHAADAAEAAKIERDTSLWQYLQPCKDHLSVHVKKNGN